MAKHWVIPDIHGCSQTLKSLIEFHIKPSKHDYIYFLGDYIDRGPDTKGVIDYIMKLQDEQYNIRLLRGNHEDYLIKAYHHELERKSFLGFKAKNRMQTEWKKYGGKDCLDSFKIKDIKDIPDIYIQWMESLELYFELDNFFLVHAGFNFKNGDPFDDEHSMLWIRDFKPDPTKIGDKTVVHGHVPVSLELIYHLKDNTFLKYIDLDNGVYMNERTGYGNLLALELNSMDVVVQHNLDM